MVKFRHHSETYIKNILSEKAYSMLLILKKNPGILTRDFLKLLKRNKVSIKKSQFYRYVNSLETYNLLIVNEWKNRDKGFGRTYEISEAGEEVLSTLNEFLY